MMRIETMAETEVAVTYVLTGRVTEEHLPELARLLEAARGRGLQVILDLSGVVLVDRGFVRFLASGEGAWAELAHCPAYVRSWIRCEGNQETCQ
jgi:ABC-type transporter Mla MlaB component